MDPDPKQEMHLIENHLKIIKKISNLIIMALKNVNLTFFFIKYRYALKYHENYFFIVGIVKERIFRVGSETGFVTFY
jgi:hypothetical protein